MLVEELSTAADDQGLTVRPDGLELFLNSTRPGSELNDLWTSTRATVSAPWSPPVSMGPAINTQYNEQFPTVSADGATLIFTSNRPGGVGGDDLYIVTRGAARGGACGVLGR